MRTFFQCAHSSVTQPHAGEAIAKTNLSLRVHSNIVRRVLVSVLALSSGVLISCSGLTSGRTNPNPTLQVFASCDRFQVGRIDTTMNSTQVVQVQAWGNRTDMSFVGNPMGQTRNGTPVNSHVQASIPVGVKSARPKPASVDVNCDLVSNSIFDWFCGARHNGSLSQRFVLFYGPKVPEVRA